MVSRETKEPPALWVALVCVALKVTAECRAPRATLVCREPRATRATSAFAVPLGPLASQVLLEHRDSQGSVAQSALSVVVAQRERGAPLVRWDPVDPRATKEIVACEDRKV